MSDDLTRAIAEAVALPEHVEAVARLLHDGNPNSGTSWGDKNGFQRSPYRVRARQILTSTDPAVHAAILAVPVVREALANAWDAGYTSGHSNAMRRMSDEPNAPTTPNPHRAELRNG